MLSTHKMDGLHTAQDIADKDKCWVQCFDCGTWTLMTTSNAEPCTGCGGSRLDWTSATSPRTFNIDRAKKRKPRQSNRGKEKT